jgi:methylated-DNA-[protein]-cysteine S-methyltransferase
MAADGFALFETAIGCCGIAWGAHGVAGVQLPQADAAATRARMRQRFPAAPEAPPPEDVRQAIDHIGALFRGEPDDLSEIALDLDGVAPFDRRVYEVARAIPPGTTLTYGQIATRIGEPGAARAVGRSLGNNPFAPVVPCHRVISADGKMHGFSATGGVATKLRLLTIEGWRASEPTLF